MATAPMSARTPRKAWGSIGLSRPSTAPDEAERLDWRAQAQNILASDRATVHGLADASRRIQHSETGEQHSRNPSKASVDALPRPHAFVPSKLTDEVQKFRVEAQNTRRSNEKGRLAVLTSESDVDVLIQLLHSKRLIDLLNSDRLSSTAPAKSTGTGNALSSTAPATSTGTGNPP